MTDSQHGFAGYLLPTALRRRYYKVLDARNDGERMTSAFHLWQDTVVYLGSLAFAEYRRHRPESPSPRVEAIVDKWPRLWTENYAELLRASLRDGPQPGIFAPSIAASIKLEKAESLRRAVNAVDAAVQAHYPTCMPLVERELAGPGKQSLTLGQMLNLLVSYRNKAIGHSDTSAWRDIEDLERALAPHVEGTAVELLGRPEVQHVILTYPVGELLQERNGHEGIEHRLRLEFRGRERRATVQRPTAITADFNAPSWPAREGGKLLLHADEEDSRLLSPRIIGPFHDFLMKGVEPPRFGVWVHTDEGLVSDDGPASSEPRTEELARSEPRPDDLVNSGGEETMRTQEPTKGLGIVAPIKLADLERRIVDHIKAHGGQFSRDAVLALGDPVVASGLLMSYTAARWDKGRWLGKATLRRMEAAFTGSGVAEASGPPLKLADPDKLPDLGAGEAFDGVVAIDADEDSLLLPPELEDEAEDEADPDA